MAINAVDTIESSVRIIGTAVFIESGGEDTKMRGYEDGRMRRWEDARMRGYWDTKMRGWEDGRIGGCEERGWEDAPRPAGGINFSSSSGQKKTGSEKNRFTVPRTGFPASQEYGRSSGHFARRDKLLILFRAKKKPAPKRTGLLCPEQDSNLHTLSSTTTSK